MRNPYFTEGPTVISFSGGRTSGYMLKQVLDTHNGVLPDKTVFVFANTRKMLWLGGAGRVLT